MRHHRADDGIRSATHIVAAGDADTFAVRESPVLVLPAGSIADPLNALRVAIAQHAQIVHSPARRLQEVTAADFNRINAQHGGDSVELLLEGKASVYCTVTTHGTTGRLVGQDAVAVELDVGDIVHGVEQLSGIEDGDHTVTTVGTAILDDAHLHRRQFALASDSRL